MPKTTTAPKPDLSLWSTPDSLSFAAYSFEGAVQAIRTGIAGYVFPVVPAEIDNIDRAFDKVTTAHTRYFADNPADAAGFVSDAVDRVLAGADLDEEFAASLRDHLYVSQMRATGAQMIQNIEAQLRYRQPRIVSDAVPAMLVGLRDHLEQLLTRVRHIDQVLDGLDITDPTAIAGATDEQRAVFPDFPGLVAEYWRIRNGQKVLTIATNQPPPGNTADTHRWTWAEYLDDRPFWEFTTGNPLEGEGMVRLLAVARLGTAWLPTYDQLVDKYDDWWNTDAPGVQSLTAIPRPRDGQHLRLQRGGHFPSDVRHEDPQDARIARGLSDRTEAASNAANPLGVA